MELLQLKYFKEVAECGKIKTAAERLFIAPPSLSTTISRLEKDLGTKLFNRSNNRIELNEQGEICLRYVEQILGQLDSMQEEIRDSLIKRKHNIQVAMTASNLWTGLLTEYLMKNSEEPLSCVTVKVPISGIDIMKKNTFLLAEKDDLISEGMDSVTLFYDRPVVILNPKHPLAERKSVTLEELREELLILPIAGQSLNKRIRELYQKAKQPMKIINECSNANCEALVACNCGISFSTEHTWHTNQSLCYVPLTIPDSQWEQRLYWHSKRQLTEEEERFKAFVIRFSKEHATGERSMEI